MNVIKKFASLNGAKFIGIDNYENRNGEISNQTINTNISVENAKKSDLETLKNFDVNSLDIQDVELAKNALSELTIALEKNLSPDIKDRTNQSQAQTTSFTTISKGLRLNNETLQVQITGFAHSKTIIKKGEYKEVKKQPKTVIKDMIRKGLKMKKFRSFYLGSMNELHITGDTIQIL